MPHSTIEYDVVIHAAITVLGGKNVIGEGSVIGGNIWIVNSISTKNTVIGSPTFF